MFLVGGPGSWPVDSQWKVGHWTWNEDRLGWDPDLDNPVLTPLLGCNWADSSEVILQGDTALGWVSNCFDVYHVTAPMVLFADDLESGDTSGWSAAIP